MDLLKEQYKIIGHLKAIRKQLNLICERLEIETLPTIKMEIETLPKKYLKKEERKGEEREKEEIMFIRGTGTLK